MGSIKGTTIGPRPGETWLQVAWKREHSGVDTGQNFHGKRKEIQWWRLAAVAARNVWA